MKNLKVYFKSNTNWLEEKDRKSNQDIRVGDLEVMINLQNIPAACMKFHGELNRKWSTWIFRWNLSILKEKQKLIDLVRKWILLQAFPLLIEFVISIKKIYSIVWPECRIHGDIIPIIVKMQKYWWLQSRLCWPFLRRIVFDSIDDFLKINLRTNQLAF